MTRLSTLLDSDSGTASNTVPIHDIATRAVRGGLSPDPITGAILTPIYQSTTYVQDEVGVHKGYTYSRSANPTVAALERNLASLEGTSGAVAFSTGMSAITGLCLSLVKSGDRVVAGRVVYGGTYRLLDQILKPLGVHVDFVDASSNDALREALERPARLVIVESPANPTLELVDLAAAATIAHDAGALLAVDNTFLTPLGQDCFGLGADIVAHSTTKYLEGHDSTVGGALVARDEALLERFRFVRNATGTIQSPFEAWLTLRGIKTLPLRFARQSETALEIARFLESDLRIARVRHPFLESFPQAALALRQQRLGGGLVAFELAGGVRAGLAFMNALRLCSRAENLGAVESLVTHPATMTHASIPRAERERVGITDGLVRFSAGLEAPSDLIADLAQALDAVKGD